MGRAGGEAVVGQEAAWTAEALGALRDARGEARLLAWLEVADPTLQQVAAAQALGNVGTITAVEPLVELARAGLLDTAPRRAAREAIRAIQARLGPVDAGRVSLVDLPPTAGDVAIVTGEGAVSEAPDDRGGGLPIQGPPQA